MTATTLTSQRAQLSSARALEPAYAAPEDRDQPTLRLDRNEGPCCDIATLAALQQLTADDVRRYTTPAVLEAAIARQFDVDRAKVLVTSGADDAIDRCCRVMLRDRLSAIVPAPTFEMIPRGVQRTGATLIEVDWLDGALPTADIVRSIDDSTRLISIVTPNNPTGLIATADDIATICQAAPHALIMVDLAYGEFADVDLMPAVLEQFNAIAIRTFSKAFGMAGLRAGYALGSPQIIGWLRSMGSPYPCSSVSLALVGRLIEQGVGPSVEYLEHVRTERSALCEQLATAGWRVWDSQSNFVLASNPNAGLVEAMLRAQGIAVRSFSEPSLRTALRITCPGNCVDFTMLQGALGVALAQTQERCNG